MCLVLVLIAQCVVTEAKVLQGQDKEVEIQERHKRQATGWIRNPRAAQRAMAANGGLREKREAEKEILRCPGC